MAFQGEGEERGRIWKNPKLGESQAWSARRPGTRQRPAEVGSVKGTVSQSLLPSCPVP